MKGIILAGGLGTRLRPLTKIINKSILPVYDKPLIYYPIFTLRDAGITNILIVSGREHAGQFLDLLGSGRHLGVNLSYDIQEEPKGIAHGLAVAEDFTDNDKVALILGDNIYEDSLAKAVHDFQKQEKGAKIIIKQVPDPERFGVMKFNGDKIIACFEKPKNPPSNWIQTGFYLYDNRVFDMIRKLKPSKRGEYEILDLNNLYLKEGTLTYQKIKGRWIDAGTFDSLLEANNFIAKKTKNEQFLKKTRRKYSSEKNRKRG
ncbi:MAG: spore coat protein [Candidatus Portnoybacteria bacterium RIFCSPLOWO2_01_FULL_43_11]|uniref:glucose-1-phosphate thymidylyltransferase n=4 Tax=Candidatus Portnoyibacteriota TaxID=1817913 RepID=A0A1G2FBQ8_9BACT|nr:MAG: spore coat protein [Candidatus Portnoybacteria bacterium RIFCSPHIGHO2_01_FULL_40_12b]OGZ38683.1 MAG: spore coat protein [Candidatus Portnoybacteria bacterium RIFCSPLOWO2_01_FULL_43_11]OGZ39262.1 MAG: spore coat protein [Candidatus Portnoybacteria bacterium RIFCSPHIGHO2_12_FULL_40_11]OGZ41052.1 MAG: spore coat protein [Candidatus Portnoybacteria bacterium RIFCSPLOWO2_02_FULL_40_15]